MHNLLEICIYAFVAVLVLLSLLSCVIHLVSRLFPVRKSDQEWITEALQQAVDTSLPGAKVIRVEEVTK